MNNQKDVKWSTFLKDVGICSLGAYGGPEAHYGVFTDQLVVKKKYLSEEELMELIALTGILPGPSSTQTITAIGHKIGGPILALLTLLVWALPAIIIMTMLSFLYLFLTSNQLDPRGLRFIAPMAVALISVAAYRLSKKILRRSLLIFLFLFAGIITFFLRQSWVFPTVLLIGGFSSIFFSKEPKTWSKVKLGFPWKYLVFFLIFAFGSILLDVLLQHRLTYLFSLFYRYGYMVIGGGQVVVPYMVSDLVEIHQYLTMDQFLTGFGIVQGIPGPMFSFSAYAGGIASSTEVWWVQVLGGLLSGIAIFLPGTLLIFFVYPVWSKLRLIPVIQLAMKGITAVAAGLITSAAIKLMQASGFSIENILVFVISFVLLLSKKVPAPVIVLLSLLFGFILL